MQTVFSLDLPGIPKVRSGKVREVFDLGNDGLLLVATDRLSAFDCILPDPIPHKGAVLNGLSAFWFQRFRALVEDEAGGVANHFLTADFRQFPEKLRPFEAQLAGRSMLVQRTQPLPVECVVRGYLAGSGWKEYRERGTVGGHRLPPGLRLGDRLPDEHFPLFTPSSKAEEGHDENLTWGEFVARLGGDETFAGALRLASKLFYLMGAKYAAERGIVIADTKFEFGADEIDGEIMLIDECLTPDSSRFWPSTGWEPGSSPPSYDKQFVRDYLETLDWDKSPPAPGLPAEVIAQTSSKYRQAFARLTGAPLATSDEAG